MTSLSSDPSAPEDGTSNRLEDDPVPLVSADLLPAYRHHNLAAIQRFAARQSLQPACERFTFLRHGQTGGNFNRVFQPAEIPLNDTGLAQAAKAAEVLKDRGIERIFASDMKRAQQTAQCAADSTGASLTWEPGLRERWFGDLVGTSSIDLDWGYDPPNGETLEDFVARVCAAAGKRLNDASASSTLLVAHGGVLYAIAFALGAQVRPEHVENATPLSFDRRDGRWTITPLALTATSLGASGV